MSQMMLVVFSLLWFLYSEEIKIFCQYVVHSSQSVGVTLS